MAKATAQPSSAASTATKDGAFEELVMKIPTPVFFLPLVFGTVLTYLFEKVLRLETWLEGVCSTMSGDGDGHHPMALVGLGIFGMEVLQRWMTGRINHARHRYGVPVPTLYLTKSEHKHYNEYNTYQRCHHNFLENYPQWLAGTYFTAVVAKRPYTAGFVLLAIAFLRVLYTRGYTHDVKSRGGFFLMTIILGEVLTIYSLSAATPLFGFRLFGI